MSLRRIRTRTPARAIVPVRWRAAVALLLVLLHLLEPGLHLLQHTVTAHGHAASGSACSHSACQEGAAVRTGAAADDGNTFVAGELTRPHDCALCAQLQRTHDYVAPTRIAPAATALLVARATTLRPVAPHARRPLLPPARGPPHHAA